MARPTFIIDFDSTLVTCESLDELARLSLATHDNKQAIMQEVESLTSRGMAGEIAFYDSLQARLELFAATRTDIRDLVADLKTKVSPSALKSRGWFKENWTSIYIVSGGFEEYIIPIAELLDIPPSHVHANRFIFDGDQIVGFDAMRQTSQPGGKAKQVAALKLPRPIIAIGDGFTDYEIKEAGYANEFWAFTETTDRAQVTKKADRIVSSFSEVLDLTLASI
jgi:D-3-phosphoglycerate dehydrogenase / 2-oxoglutarate reductase